MNSLPIEAKFIIQLQVSELKMLIEKSFTTKSKDNRKGGLNLTIYDDERVTNLTGQQIIDIICDIKSKEPEQSDHQELAKQGILDGIELINRHDLSRYFNVSMVTIDKWTKKGCIPKPIKISGAVYFNKIEIEAFLKSKNKR
jgi:predicted DNA-binding transcriptional regulator AlpA